MNKINKMLKALVPALTTFAETMVQSNACSSGLGEPKIPKSLRK